jgi:hypothetical protein
VVELANARESSRQRDLRNRQIGLLDKVPSKLNPMSDRDLNRRRSQMLDKKTPQLP